MKIIESSFVIDTPISEGGIKELKKIERYARKCYKSEDSISEDGESAKKLISKLIYAGHEAMLEHSQLSVIFVCDRGVSHELVRHRLCSFAQESTRYCNYSKGKFGEEITVVFPKDYDSKWPGYSKHLIIALCRLCEKVYMELIKHGHTPQEARCVLPNALKTEVVVTANYREWRNIFKLRCARDAHPDMRELMVPLWFEMKRRIPIIFDDCYDPSDSEIIDYGLDNTGDCDGDSCPIIFKEKGTDDDE